MGQVQFSALNESSNESTKQNIKLDAHANKSANSETPTISETSANSTHIDAVRRVLFQYIKRQTRREVQDVPSIYLHEMLQAVRDFPTFRLLFQKWTFATRPRLDSNYVKTSLDWIDKHQSNSEELAAFTNSLITMSKPVFEGGKRSKKQSKHSEKIPQVYSIVFQKDMQKVGMVKQDLEWMFPHKGIRDGNVFAAHEAVIEQLGIELSPNDMFIGQKILPNGTLLYAFQLTSI